MSRSSHISHFLRGYRAYLVLGFLVTIALISNLAWLTIDKKPVETRDSTRFLSTAIDLIARIKSEDPGLSVGDLAGLETSGGRPPLFQWAGTLSVALFGETVDAFLYANLLLYALLIVATYNIGRLVHSNNAGLLAALLVTTYPPVVRLSKVLLANFAVIAWSALTIWLVLRFMKSRLAKDAWLVNLSIAFGLWIHPTFLLGVPIPAALLQLFTVFFATGPKWVTQLKEFPVWFIAKLRQPFFLRGVLPSALVSIAIILLWYLPFGSFLLNTVEDVSAINVNGKFFLGPSLDLPPFLTSLWFALTSRLVVSSLLALFFGVSLIAALIKRQLLALALAFMFALAYFFHSLMVGYGWRYFSQVLPLAAVLTSSWVLSIRHRLISVVIAGVCIATSLFNYAFVSWDTINVTGTAADALGISTNAAICRPSFAFFCSDPPQLDQWPLSEMLGTVIDNPQCSSGECDLLILPGSNYFFQGVFFHIAIDYPDQELGFHILLEQGETRYFNFPALLESEFIFYNSGAQSQSLDNAESATNRLATSFFQSLPPLFAASHQAVGKYRMPDGSNAIIYQRVKPLTREEAEEVVSAVKLMEKREALKYKVFIGLATHEGDVNKVMSLYQEAITQVADPALREEYKEDVVTFYIEIAEAYLQGRKPEAALAVYQQVLSLQPDHVEAHLGLALSYDAQGLIEEAREEFLLVIELGPGTDFAARAQNWLDTHG